MSEELRVFCMTPTPFHPDLTLDEEALRAQLRRLVAAKTGLFMASGGAGEAHVLTPKELGRIYAIGVEEGKGKVPVWAGLRESRSADAMYEVANEAVKAGCEAVQIYQLDNGHGMIPSQREQEAYWYQLLDAIKTPVAISIHYDAKFKAPTPFLKKLVEKYEQIIAFNLVGSQIGYFIEMREAIPQRIAMNVGAPEFMMHGSLGATGFVNPINNLIPYVCRSLVDAWMRNDLATASKANRTIQRALRIVNQWAPSTARWVKMGMKLNGTGNGVLRLPYVLPPDEELQKMQAQFDALGVVQLEREAKQYVEKVSA